MRRGGAEALRSTAPSWLLVGLGTGQVPRKCRGSADSAGSHLLPQPLGRMGGDFSTAPGTRDLEGWASLKAPGAPLRLRRSPPQGLTNPQAAPCSGPWEQPLSRLSERWEPGNAALRSRRLPEPHFLPCLPGR